MYINKYISCICFVSMDGSISERQREKVCVSLFYLDREICERFGVLQIMFNYHVTYKKCITNTYKKTKQKSVIITALKCVTYHHK